MKKQWEKLEAWLRINHPSLLGDLNPPASDADILELEQRLGIALPTDYIASLKIHNGQKGRDGWLFNNREFLSTQQTLMSWSAWNDLLDEGDLDDKVSRPDASIQSGWWRKAWVPFATDGCGNYLCLDLSPSASGQYGQVINVFHDVQDRTREATSFTAWFENLVGNKQD